MRAGAFHLLAMAVLGGAVLVSNAQLLGLGFRDTDFVELQSQCYRLLGWALFVVIGTGVFMACGVAVKVYYLDVFWYKMLALWVGCLFEYLLKRPLIGDAGAVAEQGVLRLVAVASLMLWFTVAATGRWIGFSG